MQNIPILYTVLSLLSLSSILGLTFFVYRKNYHHPLNRSFFILMSAFAFWQVFELKLIFNGTDKNLLWLKCLLSLIVITAGSFSAFCGIFSRNLDNKTCNLKWFFLLIPGIAFLLYSWIYIDSRFSLFFQWSTNPPELYFWGFTIPKTSGIHFFKAILIIYLITGYLFLKKYLSKSSNPIIRKQVTQFLFSLFLPLIILIGSNIFYKYSQLSDYFQGSHFYQFGLFPSMLILQTLLLSFTIVRNQLLNVNVIFNRTVINSIVTTIAAGVYIISEEIAEILFTSLFPGQTNLYGIIAALIVAVLFSPLYRWMDRFISGLLGSEIVDEEDNSLRLSQYKSCPNDLLSIFEKIIKSSTNTTYMEIWQQQSLSLVPLSVLVNPDCYSYSEHFDWDLPFPVSYSDIQDASIKKFIDSRTNFNNPSVITMKFLDEKKWIVIIDISKDCLNSKEELIFFGIQNILSRWEMPVTPERENIPVVETVFQQEIEEDIPIEIAFFPTWHKFILILLGIISLILHQFSSGFFPETKNIFSLYIWGIILPLMLMGIYMVIPWKQILRIKGIYLILIMIFSFAGIVGVNRSLYQVSTSPFSISKAKFQETSDKITIVSPKSQNKNESFTIIKKYWKPQMFLINLFLFLAAMSISILIARNVEDVSHIFAIALIGMVMDVWSVFFGATKSLVSSPFLANHFLLNVPLLNKSNIFFPLIGATDLLFLSLFVLLMKQFSVTKFKLSTVVMFISVTITIFLAIYLQRPLPVLPLISIALIFTQWRNILPSKKDFIQIIIGSIILLFVFSFVHQRISSKKFTEKIPKLSTGISTQPKGK